MQKLLLEGKVPSDYDLEMAEKGTFDAQDIECLFKYANKPRPYPHLMGQVAGSIHEIESAKEIVENMVISAAGILDKVHRLRKVHTASL